MHSINFYNTTFGVSSLNRQLDAVNRVPMSSFLRRIIERDIVNFCPLSMVQKVAMAATMFIQCAQINAAMYTAAKRMSKKTADTYSQKKEKDMRWRPLPLKEKART